jgi:hypothetical protein
MTGTLLNPALWPSYLLAAWYVMCGAVAVGTFVHSEVSAVDGRHVAVAAGLLFATLAPVFAVALTFPA